MSQENATNMTVMEEDDYMLFEASRNKEIAALSAEYAAMLRRQRITISMAETFVQRVPALRRDGVVSALRVQNEDLVQMRRRFAHHIQEAIRAQSRVFDVRMRFESESSMLMSSLKSNFFHRLFQRKKNRLDQRSLQGQVVESIAELKSSMDDWAQSMSLIYRLLPEWRRIQDEMVCFMESQQSGYRKTEQLVDQAIAAHAPADQSLERLEKSSAPFLNSAPVMDAAKEGVSRKRKMTTH